MNQQPTQGIDIELPQDAPSPAAAPKTVRSRPSMRPERRYYAVNVLVLFFIFAAISLFLVFGKRPEKSAEENRDLAPCPRFSLSSYFDGSFTTEFSQYFNDSVPMRSFFKGVIADFRGNLGVPYDEEIILIGSIPEVEKITEPNETEPHTQFAPMQAQPTVPTEYEPATRPTEPATTGQEIADPTEATEPENDYENFDGEIANNILIVKDRGLMLYNGTQKNAEYYAKTLNAYKTALGSDVNVYSLVAPTAVSYYLPSKFADCTASEKDNINHLNSLFEDVVPVDAYGALEAHKSEAIYSRTDHHWQPLGAYYAAEEFAKTASVSFAPMSAYETAALDNYVGTLYGYTGNAVFKDNPEPFVYYKPTNAFTTTYYNTDMTNAREGSLLLRNVEQLDPSSWYLEFMGGADRITHITTDCTNDRRLLIIKDSYGNALVPCLTRSFSEIWVIDMRYFEPKVVDFAKEHEITDVLFAMNTFSAMGGNAKNLETIMK